MSSWIPGYDSIAYAMSSAGQAVTGIFETPPSQPLDPMSCIGRLAELSYKIEGTRIAFRGRHIVLQAPGMSQTIERSLKGDAHGDLALLGPPIRAACKILETIKDERLRFLADRALKALVALRDFYQEELKRKRDPAYRATCEVLFTYIQLLDKLIKEGPCGDQTDQSFAEALWNESDIESFVCYLRKAEEAQDSPLERELCIAILDAILQLKESGKSLESMLPGIINEIRDQSDRDEYNSSPEPDAFAPQYHYPPEQNVYQAPKSGTEQLAVLYSHFLDSQAGDRH